MSASQQIGRGLSWGQERRSGLVYEQVQSLCEFRAVIFLLSRVFDRLSAATLPGTIRFRVCGFVAGGHWKVQVRDMFWQVLHGQAVRNYSRG